MIKDTNTRYIEAIGRRKTSLARVRITPDTKQHITINEKPLNETFQTAGQQKTVEEALLKTDPKIKFKVTAHVKGGGMSSQAESVRLGISRALVEFDHNLRGTLKKDGFLKRDPRSKERRKFGLKKARKAPQWSKR